MGVRVYYSSTRIGQARCDQTAFLPSVGCREGLTRGYAARLAPEGITCNAVAPGLIDSEMAAPLKEAGYASRIPVGRFGTAEEVAEAVMMLVGNAFIAGQTIAVNGGLQFT